MQSYSTSVHLCFGSATEPPVSKFFIASSMETTNMETVVAELNALAVDSIQRDCIWRVVRLQGCHYPTVQAILARATKPSFSERERHVCENTCTTAIATSHCDSEVIEFVCSQKITICTCACRISSGLRYVDFLDNDDVWYCSSALLL